MIVEAFDGLHLFRSTFFSEHLYNAEHDFDECWLDEIQKYQPKIIHFKARRFRSKKLRQRVAALLTETGVVRLT